MSILVRRATIDESERVACIFRVAKERALRFLPVLHTPEEDFAFFRTRVFPSCEVWVSENYGIVGFIALREGWIDHLYIDPEHQRRGHGRALLEHAKSRSSQLDLWTFQKNLDAIAFYEANGFRSVRETDGAGNEEREPDALYRWTRS